MFRRSVSVASKGVRQLSFWGKERQNFQQVREKYDISHKWVFLRRQGKDDLIIVLFSLSTLFTVGCVGKVVFKMATGQK